MMGTWNRHSRLHYFSWSISTFSLAQVSRKNGWPWCNHYKKPGHTKDTGWKVHGKPVDWKPKIDFQNHQNTGESCGLMAAGEDKIVLKACCSVENNWSSCKSLSTRRIHLKPLGLACSNNIISLQFWPRRRKSIGLRLCILVSPIIWLEIKIYSIHFIHVLEAIQNKYK